MGIFAVIEYWQMFRMLSFFKNISRQCALKSTLLRKCLSNYGCIKKFHESTLNIAIISYHAKFKTTKVNLE